MTCQRARRIYQYHRSCGGSGSVRALCKIQCAQLTDTLSKEDSKFLIPPRSAIYLIIIRCERSPLSSPFKQRGITQNKRRPFKKTEQNWKSPRGGREDNISDGFFWGKWECFSIAKLDLEDERRWIEINNWSLWNKVGAPGSSFLSLGSCNLDHSNISLDQNRLILWSLKYRQILK